MNTEIYKNKLDSFIDEIFELNDIPGISIGVSAGSFFEYRAVRGYRDFTSRNSDQPELLQIDDIFHCASVSKLFTSSAVMNLVRASKSTDAKAGRLPELESRLTELLPELPFEDDRIGAVKLWHMLTHTSGIGDCDDYRWYAPDMKPDAIKRYVYSDEVCSQPMLWEPQDVPCSEDNRFRYSNVAYEMLGHIASEYSAAVNDGVKLEYEDLISRLFFEPLGMTSSSMKTFARKDWGSPAMAKPHEKNDDNRIVLTKDYPYNPAHAPSSTLTTNTGDLLKWGRYHLENADKFKDVWTPYATVPNNGEKMGLGWFIRKQRISGMDYTLYGHEGTDDGFRASFWICPELDIVTVVLSNMSAAPVKKINKQLFAKFIEIIGE